MGERPAWLRVVGGKDYEPDVSTETHDDAVPAAPPEEEESTADYGRLITLWLEITDHLPVDYATSSRAERVREAAADVRSWTVRELHGYLSKPDIWTKPSYTRAVLDEVAERMRRNDFSPR